MRWVRRACVLLLLLAALLGLVYAFLPGILNRWVIPALAEKSGARLQVRVERCDVAGLVLRDLSFDTGPVRFSAPEITVSWRLAGLRHGEVEEVRVRHGLLDVDPSRVPRIPPAAGGGDPDAGVPVVVAPFSIHRLVLEDAGLTVVNPGKGSPAYPVKVEVRGLAGETAVFHRKTPALPRQPGLARMKELVVNGVRIGSASANLHPGNSSMQVEGQGTLDGSWVRDGGVSISGRVAFGNLADPALDLCLVAPPVAFAWPCEPLLRLLPPVVARSLPALEFSAQIKAAAFVRGTARKPIIPLALSLSGGALSLPEKSLSISGLRADFALPDLLAMATGPEQKVSFDSLKLGEIELGSVRMACQVEPGGVFFVEEALATWCGGTLRLYSMRARSPQDLRFVFFCDQVRLDEVLKKIGFEDITTNAALTGRVPLRLRDGTVEITQGELYSHPGIKGTLQIGKADILAAQIAPNSPEYGNVRFTMAALKHLLFDWILMKVDTRDGQVRVAVSVYGKPAKPLPFRYDSATGSFVSISLRGEKGIDQPVQLDMNVNLPLNLVVYDRKGLRNLLRDLKPPP